MIGKNIRIRRSLKGYSQETLGRCLGVTFQQVQKYEKGTNAISPAKLLHLSRIFTCGVEDFFRDPAQNKNSLAFVPGRRSLELVKSFERLDSVDVQRRIGDLVHALAKSNGQDS
jgi:transcriptional regulator with XRE-family HTH domain